MRKKSLLAVLALIVVVYATQKAMRPKPDKISQLKIRNTMMWYDALCPRSNQDVDQLVNNLNKKQNEAKILFEDIKQTANKQQRSEIKEIWKQIKHAHKEKMKLYKKYRTALKNNEQLGCEAANDGTPMLFAPAPAPFDTTSSGRHSGQALEK